MSLKNIQSVICSLLLDDSLRIAVKMGDESSRVKFCLSSSEYESVRTFFKGQERAIESYSLLLKNKQKEKLLSYFLLYRKYIGHDDWQLIYRDIEFSEYLAKLEDQIIIISNRLEETTAKMGLFHRGIPQLKEILTFEKIKALILESPYRPGDYNYKPISAHSKLLLVKPAQIETFSYNPNIYSSADETDLSLNSPFKKRFTMLFFRSQGEEVQMQAAIIDHLLEFVLNRLDGAKPISEIIEIAVSSKLFNIDINALFANISRLTELKIVGEKN